MSHSVVKYWKFEGRKGWTREVRKEGKEEGRREGRREGRNEGREEGREGKKWGREGGKKVGYPNSEGRNFLFTDDLILYVEIFNILPKTVRTNKWIQQSCRIQNQYLQSHNEMSPHPSKNGYYQNQKWRQRNPCTLLEGMQTSTAIMENKVEVPQQIKI
jgi:hypothetical protein